MSLPPLVNARARELEELQRKHEIAYDVARASQKKADLAAEQKAWEAVWFAHQRLVKDWRRKLRSEGIDL